MDYSREAIRGHHSWENTKRHLKLNIIIAIAFLGLALQSATPAYSSIIYERDRLKGNPTATSTITPARKDQTPVFTPTRTNTKTPSPSRTPMFPYPTNVKLSTCIDIPPNQLDFYTQPKDGKPHLFGRNNIFLYGQPGNNQFTILHPGDPFPSNFNIETDQLRTCDESFLPTFASSPTPSR